MDSIKNNSFPGNNIESMLNEYYNTNTPLLLSITHNSFTYTTIITNYYIMRYKDGIDICISAGAASANLIIPFTHTTINENEIWYKEGDITVILSPV